MTGHIIFTAVLFVLGVSGALILWKRASVPLPSQEEVEAVAGKLAGPLHLAQLTAHEGRILRDHSAVVLLALAKHQARESDGRAFRGQSGGGPRPPWEHGETYGGGRRPDVPPPPPPIRDEVSERQ